MRVLVGLPTLLLALLLTATAAHAAGQASCRVSYSSNTKLPLIFGGVNQGCQGLRCQSRLGPLGAKCGAQDGSSWGVCTADQATYALSECASLDTITVRVSGKAVKMWQGVMDICTIRPAHLT